MISVRLYKLTDMTADTLAVLDGHQIPAAHTVNDRPGTGAGPEYGLGSPVWPFDGRAGGR
jgi:hypothetical protein